MVSTTTPADDSFATGDPASSRGETENVPDNQDEGGTGSAPETSASETGETTTTTGGTETGETGAGETSGTGETGVDEGTSSPTNPCPSVALPSVVPHAYEGTTTGQANLGGGPCGGNRAPEVLHVWSAPYEGYYRISTAGSSFVTVVYVTNGIECFTNDIVCRSGEEDQEPAVTGFFAEAGQTVTIAVDGVRGAEGPYRLTLEEFEF